MQCELDIYHDEPGQRYCYVKSGSNDDKFVIFIPGLTDGLLAVKYLNELQIALNKIGWSLIQFIYASSYNGYGTSSIDNDIKHIKLLIHHLIDKCDTKSFILLGFSTGCQDSVYFMKQMDEKIKSLIKGIIFHGPVSDREYEMTFDEYKDNIDLAKKLIKDKQSQNDTNYNENENENENKDENVDKNTKELVLMPIDKMHGIAVTAQRYLSLNSKMSKEDMFSSDLTDKELYEQLGHLYNLPLLIVMCGNDEYVPEHIDKRSVQRMCTTISSDSNKNNDNIIRITIQKI